MRDRWERAFGIIGLAYVLGMTAAVIARDWWREHRRVEGVIAETRDELAARADTIYGRVRAMQAGEASARYDRAAWGDE